MLRRFHNATNAINNNIGKKNRKKGQTTAHIVMVRIITILTAPLTYYIAITVVVTTTHITKENVKNINPLKNYK